MRFAPRLRVVHLLAAILVAIGIALIAVILSRPATVRSRETPRVGDTPARALSLHLEREQAGPAAIG